MDAEKLPSWQSEQRVELDRLLAQKACLEKELEALRSKHRSVAESESLTTRLRSLNQQLLVDLRDMRRRQLETEAKCESMAEALAHANARLAVQSRADRGRVGNEALAADNTVPGERLSALEAALRQSQAKLQECEEALSRSLREKSMIEDRFLQDDATR